MNGQFNTKMYFGNRNKKKLNIFSQVISRHAWHVFTKLEAKTNREQSTYNDYQSQVPLLSIFPSYIRMYTYTKIFVTV